MKLLFLPFPFRHVLEGSRVKAKWFPEAIKASYPAYALPVCKIATKMNGKILKDETITI